jgi:hypothetical protein
LLDHDHDRGASGGITMKCHDGKADGRISPNILGFRLQDRGSPQSIACRKHGLSLMRGVENVPTGTL